MSIFQKRGSATAGITTRQAENSYFHCGPLSELKGKGTIRMQSN